LGRYPLKIEETVFKLSDYRRFLADNADAISASKQAQQAAFDAERERWLATGQAQYDDSQHATEQATDTFELPDNAVIINNSVSGNVWKILVNEGDIVNAGDTLAIIESMKMEFTVTASVAGQVLRINCREGSAIQAGHEAIILAV
jgi:urea carboxylase